MIKALNKLQSALDKKEAEVEAVAPTTKQCPFCCSTVDIKATRCPHCTSELEAEKTKEAPKTRKPRAKK